MWIGDQQLHEPRPRRAPRPRRPRVQTQAPQAPLVPALTSLILVFSQGVMQGFATLRHLPGVFGHGQLRDRTATSGPRFGALAAIVVAASPGAFAFSPELIFALPAAALLAAPSIRCFAARGMQRTASRSPRRRDWADAARKDDDSRLRPGIAASAPIVALLVRPRQDSLPGALNLAVAGRSAHSRWLRPGTGGLDFSRRIPDRFGYGAEAANFGKGHATFSWSWWHAAATLMTSADLLLPLAVLVLAALIAIGVAAVRRVLEADNRRSAIGRLLRSEVLGVTIVFLAGYLALSTSRNSGSGFTLPIAVLLPPIAVVALRIHRRAVVPAVAAVVLVTGLNVLATSSFSEALARKRIVDLPLFGAVPWVNGVPRAVEAIRAEAPGPETRFDTRDRGWPRADVAFSRYLFERLSTPLEVPLVAFGMRNRVFNTNTVQLQALQAFRQGVPAEQLVADFGNGPAAYVSQLTDPTNGIPGVVLTMSSNEGDFSPRTNQASVEAAAQRVGLRVARTMTLPDGRLLRIWVKRNPRSPSRRRRGTRQIASATIAPPIFDEPAGGRGTRSGPRRPRSHAGSPGR